MTANPRVESSLMCVGVDWVTLTCSDRDSIDILREIAVALAESEFYEGSYARPCGFSGYEGLQVGSLYFGERHDGICLRLGSHLASAHYHRLLPLASNVTRIDLQVTFRVNCSPSDIVGRDFLKMKAHNKKLKRGPALSMFLGSDGSRTLYSGSRSSDRFGRAYDKWLQSKLECWRNCLRYEVEFKGKRARRVAESLMSGFVETEGIYQSVLRFFSDRGGISWTAPAESSSSAILIDSSYRATHPDTERSLAWLAKCVRPTVERLISRDLFERTAYSLGVSQSLSEVVH
jgi:DNA relaxase NicK